VAAILSVGTLAIGIAAASAIFTIVNAIMLRPLPYRDSDRLVILWSVNDTDFLRYAAGAKSTPCPQGRLTQPAGNSSLCVPPGPCGSVLKIEKSLPLCISSGLLISRSRSLAPKPVRHLHEEHIV
jgi:hypothetical protein